MCGRYVLKRKDLEELMAQLGVKDPREFVSRYNIAPTTLIPAIRPSTTQPMREAAALQWGLIPSWSKDAKSGAKLANARSEGVASKPAFREAIRKRRCVIPASGFYEWQTLGRLKQPWFFNTKDDTPFVFAGLWERWRSVDGVEIQSCCLLTTSTNAVVGQVHDRMPVILEGAAIDTWLNPDLSDPAALEPLCAPLPDDRLKATPVSPRVNSVAYDGPDCLEPVVPLSKAEPLPQLSLDFE